MVKCSKNNFWVAIRNPVYCGRIFIPKYKEEESMVRKGLHEPLIRESLFYDVQDVLDGRRKRQRIKQLVDKNLPLRGFLLCPKCDRTLTGSASKGKRQYYHYYHCTRSTCGCRFNANTADELFDSKIKQYWPKPGMTHLYRSAIIYTYYKETGYKSTERRQLIKEIDLLEARLKNAREMYAEPQLLI